MRNRVKVEPAVEPITLAEARQYLGIAQTSDTSRDAIISTHITSARVWAEQYTRRAFITQTLELFLNSFDDAIYLVKPVQSVTSVKYYDEAGTLQTVNSANYLVEPISGTITIKSPNSWPSVRLGMNQVIVEYVTGYGLAAAVPSDIKTALKFLVGHWERYQTSMEGGVLTTVPYAVEQLLSNYKEYEGFFQAWIDR
jgi:uncharacterized phiE125 gp8 family phage protein